MRLYLEDMLESFERIEGYLAGIDEQGFIENIGVQDQVIRRLEIIGEAAKHVPKEVRKLDPNVPWRSLGVMRDMLIHAYFGVRAVRVWKTVSGELPGIRQKVRCVRESLGE